MKCPRLHIPPGLALLALAAVVSVVVPARSQTPTTTPQGTTTPAPQDNDVTWRQLKSFDQFLDNHPEMAEQIRKNPSLVNNDEFVHSHAELQQYLQQHPEVREEVSENPDAFMRLENRFDRNEANRERGDHDRDRDLTRGELASMDHFLDNHPEISEQLRKNPSLIDDKEFVSNHPELKEYLAQHPGVREEFKENPRGFMHAEERFDRREDGRDGDVTRRELASMDRFLDDHPEISEQLRKNPSLIDDKEFIGNHPELKEYMAQHPGVREEFKENPRGFMHAEERFDRREDSRDGDVTRRQLASMDRFLDDHPEISEQLQKKPALIDDREFIESHPGLREYLAQHPEVREEFKEHPRAFMHQEERFDRQEARGGPMRGDGDTTRGELTSFNGFLGGHSNIAQQLSNDPSLVNNKEYLENHPDLQQYLKAHPGVHEELSENPGLFIKSAQQPAAGGTAKGSETVKASAATKAAAKAPATDPKPKQ